MGESANLPERLENLVARCGTGDLRTMLDRFEPVRNQLLTGAAGIPGVGKDVPVFHVLVSRRPFTIRPRGTIIAGAMRRSSNGPPASHFPSPLKARDAQRQCWTGSLGLLLPVH